MKFIKGFVKKSGKDQNQMQKILERNGSNEHIGGYDPPPELAIKLQQFWLLTTDTAKNKRELLDQATQSHELVSSLQDKEFQAYLFQKP